VVHAPVATVQEQAGRWAAVEAIDGQRCRLRMLVDTLDWPLLAVGALGAEFEVRSPPELAARVGEWAERFARAAER
jgi:predicted DNA-binding transcriptional regulator YafY